MTVQSSAPGRSGQVRRFTAVAALVAAAFLGLVFGPGRGLGTDDAVRTLVTPSFDPRLPGAVRAIAPQTQAQERLRFSLQGGMALLVLAVVLLRWPKKSDDADIAERDAEVPSVGG